MLRLFKYRRFTSEEDRNRVQAILLRREIYCATPIELDDPYDCNIGTASDLMGMFVHFGVFCSSGEKHNDILLFSQYADHHTGLALVFTVDDEVTIGEGTFLSFAKEVTYVDDFPSFDRDSISQVLWTKYAAWGYQDEYRAIAPIVPGHGQLRQFEKHELTAIRFGLHMTEVDQQIIIRWANTAGMTHVKFFKARLKNDRFQLVYDQIC